jgi:AcrR family transcriptional regulator
MPKHEYSEQTKHNILVKAKELFLEKGFDNVNIEDIVSALGLTRGAFYHYFKSRDILILEVTDLMFLENNPYDEVGKMKDLTAAEKLLKAFEMAANRSEFTEDELKTQKAYFNIITNPTVLKAELYSQTETIAPFLEKLFQEGNQDGSLSIPFPKFTAQAICLLNGIWLNPAVFPLSEDQLREKMEFLIHLHKLLGLPLEDDYSVDNFFQRYQEIQENQNSR